VRNYCPDVESYIRGSDGLVDYLNLSSLVDLQYIFRHTLGLSMFYPPPFSVACTTITEVPH